MRPPASARSSAPTSSRSSIPKLSIEAEPPVAVVDKVVDKRGTRKLAEAYLNFLYTPEGQAIIAKHDLRPRDEAVLKANAAKFPPIETFTVESCWAAGQACRSSTSPMAASTTRSPSSSRRRRTATRGPGVLSTPGLFLFCAHRPTTTP